MADELKKDLIVHQFPRAKTLPNISPFCLKLETFLRLAKIPYVNDFDRPSGPYGRSPWITYKGQTVTDSTLCIEFLCDRLNVDVDAHLSSEQKAIGRSMVLMFEDHFLWAIALYRWVYDETKSIGNIGTWPWFPPFAFIHFYIRRVYTKRAEGQGMGQHPKETVMKFAKQDLKALSDFLGPKTYLFGVQPTSYDCALFGMLAQALWATPGSDYEKLMNGEFTNLKRFCNQMKEALWPDWEECLAK